MEKYVTLDRSNPDLQVHLLGEPTKNIRAIPVRSMNVNSQNEKVTFQLLPISELKRPPLFLVLLQVIRSDLLPLTLIPATAILRRVPASPSLAASRQADSPSPKESYACIS